jgi:ABC-type sugar transport system ATPase subunit
MPTDNESGKERWRMSDVRVEHLTKSFKDITAVADVTFTFASSEVTCLLGPSGCGKTTLMRIIAGLETPTSGEVYFGDQRVTHLKPSKRDIGMVFQYPVVYRGISVRENIELPLKSMKLDQAERKRRVDQVVEILDLQPHLHHDLTRLDNGTRQKVAVARAVARQPQIILFDEPITNVDAHAKLQLKQSFKELTRQLRQTIVYVTHDQTEAMTLADRIALMKDGKIVQCDVPRELYNHPVDVFGGWFLGNPGMNFFTAVVEQQGGRPVLATPLLAEPAPLAGETAGFDTITVGIRPEQVVVEPEASPGAVAATVRRKSISIGGQYLITLEREGQQFKAKAPAQTGAAVGSSAWVTIPLNRVTLFGPDGMIAPMSPAQQAAPVAV